MFYLKSIKLNGFRCFNSTNFDFESKINIIYGANAVGKTSLVESIQILSSCKSHRTTDDSDLINNKLGFYNIVGEIISNSGISNEVKIICNQKGKKISLNNKTYKNMSDYVGYFKVVMFCPEDIMLVKGTPKEKRRFLDMSICLFDKEYMKTIIRYKKILKQRNEYLKLVNNEYKLDEVLLKTYTNELIVLGKNIIIKRKNFINALNETLNSKVNTISSGNEIANIEYIPNCDEYNIEKTFETNLKFDLYSKTTSVGPHKDTFIVNINGNDSSVFASQGQQKTLTLSIKLALADVIKKYDKNLIIVLDDVFGELDNHRQNNILKLINTGNQIFITTTNINGLTEDVLKNSKLIYIEKDGN